MKTPQTLYTIEQIVEQKLLPFGDRKVRRLIHSGELPAINIGTKKRMLWRIPQKSIDTWLELRMLDHFTKPTPK